MLSHDPVRTRLRAALERSEAGKFLRGSRAAWADAWSRARVPTKAEIRALEGQGNTSSDWSGVRLLGKATLDGIRGCRLEGKIMLRLEHGAPVLRDSVLRDCIIGAATVESVALLARTFVEDGAAIRHVGEFSGRAESRFCLGLAAHPGDETGSRRVFLADGLLLADCAAMAALSPAEQEALAHEWNARLKPCVTDHAYVGAHARVEHVRFVEDCFVGPGAVVRGAAALRHCVIGSSGADPVRVGDGVLLEDCVLEAGVHIDSAAQARRSLFLEHSGAEQGGNVSDSVLGPNTAIAKGEVTASLVGPFVGMHHQSLLIGALWPEGRGNVGYGANVGSNHTGRKPDQEIRPGEGTFFGLGCSVKFPANFEDAPYSLFATGVATPPQRIALPFSLITPASGNQDRNEIQPGWMWGENAYALIRNAYKYADRNRARLHPLPEAVPPQGSPLTGTFLAADLFAPRIADKVSRALQALDKFLASSPKGIVTGKEFPALGANAARVELLAKARAAYAQYLELVALRERLWAGKSGKAAAKAGAIQALKGLGDAVEAALRKDALRGSAVFPDYTEFHPPAEKDPVCVRLRADIATLHAALG